MWFLYLMPVLLAPVIWMGIVQAICLLLLVLRETGLVQPREGAEFEGRIYLMSAGLTVVVVLWLYAEVAGITNFLDLMPG